MSNTVRPAPPIPFLPDIRRVVTGHNSEGKAIVIKDEVVDKTFWGPETVNPVHDFYRTDETPAIVDQEVSGEWVDRIAQDPALASRNGSTFRTIDLAPGAVVVRTEAPNNPWRF